METKNNSKKGNYFKWLFCKWWFWLILLIEILYSFSQGKLSEIFEIGGGYLYTEIFWFFTISILMYYPFYYLFIKRKDKENKNFADKLNTELKFNNWKWFFYFWGLLASLTSFIYFGLFWLLQAGGYFYNKENKFFNLEFHWRAFIYGILHFIFVVVKDFSHYFKIF